MSGRTCGWMSGPKDAAVSVPAVKWWFAISRGALAAELRRMNWRERSPVACGRMPSFLSPLSKRH